MSNHSDTVVSHNDIGRGTFKMYVSGYVLSISLTIAAYLLVVRHKMSETIILSWIVALALVQFIVQLVCFLHLGKETKPRWKLAVFLFMILVVLILVFGTLWIMSNLNTRMSPEQINTYMNNQGGF